jgi:hypothetical protein
MQVYCTTNIINGKKYIGSNSKSDPKYLGSGVLLKKAIKKYGKENFKKIILNEVNDLQIMKELEEYWIEYFDAYNNPMFYNATKYSSGITLFPKDKIKNISKANKGNKHHKGYKQTEYQKEQTRKANLGLKRSEEHKQKIRTSALGNKYALGTKFTQESKDKISKAKKGFKYSEESKQKMRKPKPIGFGEKTGKARSGVSKPKLYKPILQYDLEGNFIKEHQSQKHACMFINKPQATRIIDVCKGRLNSAYGFKWKYKIN